MPRNTALDGNVANFRLIVPAGLGRHGSHAKAGNGRAPELGAFLHVADASGLPLDTFDGAPQLRVAAVECPHVNAGFFQCSIVLIDLSTQAVDTLAAGLECLAVFALQLLGAADQGLQAARVLGLGLEAANQARGFANCSTQSGRHRATD